MIIFKLFAFILSAALSHANAAQIYSAGSNSNAASVDASSTGTSGNVTIDASTVFFLDLPRACDETTTKIKFIAALKKFQSDQVKLKALFHCPRIYKRISELNETDFRFGGNEIPLNIVNELQNSLNELRYGSLQIDNDLSFIECVKHLKTLPGNPKFCADESVCTANDVHQFFEDSQKSVACSKDFMKAKLQEMVDVIRAYKRLMSPEDTVPRQEFVAYIQEILNKAPVDKATEQAKVDAEKVKVKLEVRRKLEQLLGTPQTNPQNQQMLLAQQYVNGQSAVAQPASSATLMTQQQLPPPANNLAANNLTNLPNTNPATFKTI